MITTSRSSGEDTLITDTFGTRLDKVDADTLASELRSCADNEGSLRMIEVTSTLAGATESSTSEDETFANAATAS